MTIEESDKLADIGKLAVNMYALSNTILQEETKGRTIRNDLRAAYERLEKKMHELSRIFLIVHGRP